jgi:agmatine deiminase
VIDSSSSEQYENLDIQHRISRRTMLAAGVVGAFAAGCTDSDSDANSTDASSITGTPETTGPDSASTTASEAATTSTTTSTEAAGSAVPAGWYMPAEDVEHTRTWMCFPSSEEVWGEDLAAVQEDILGLATVIASYEPVTLLARPEEIEALEADLPDGVTLMEAPVDDLWARDTLPNFLVSDSEGGIAASHATFNGWGDKQIHAGDTTLAQVVTESLGIELYAPGLVGEGGGLEVDGEGTVLAARSSWVNDNRNPGMSEAEVGDKLIEMVGGERIIWIDGLAGADITDGHIDTLARFIDPTTIVIDQPAFPDDAEDPWLEVAETTRSEIEAATTADGQPYEVVAMTQPQNPRGSGDSFLSTYMNFYVCNGAVIAPEFGDAEADAKAKQQLAEMFPDREIELVPIDALAAGGGGIHCATQQEPKPAS